MRTKLTILLLACLSFATAQEKYSVVLERAQRLTPYEAIYQLMDYQQDFPQQANVYYQLGNLCYDMLPSRNALYHYNEYKELLYRSRLFYGNCLHFAKDQKLVGWQYAEIANGEKKIEYTALDAFLRPRIKEVERRQIACDSIHNSFYRLVEQYNHCQLLFNRFLTQYTREKTAHLQLTTEQRNELEQLASEAASLETLIQAYLGALTLEPLEGYNPQFRWLPIELYRLDGLTATDFLKNDVPLWDYNSWVAHFLNEQSDVYEKLYADVKKEHTKLTTAVNRYRTGKAVNDRIDETLIGRCKRLELNTPEVQAVKSMQALVQLAATEQQIAQTETLNDLRELVPLLQMVQHAEQIQQRVADPAFNSTADSAISLIQTHIIRLAQPLSLVQQPTHTSPVNGEVTSYTPLEGERVLALMVTNNGWLASILNEQTQEVLVVALDYNLEERNVLLRIADEQPLVLATLPDNKWALITEKSIYWDKK